MRVGAPVAEAIAQRAGSSVCALRERIFTRTYFMRTTGYGLLLLGCLVGLPLAACATEDSLDVAAGGVEDAELEAGGEGAALAPAGEKNLGGKGGGDISTQSQCGPTRDLQYVESYDGTAGVPASFVAYHESRVGYHVQGHCSGTLISDDLFLSAGNCGYGVGDVVRFDYQLTPDGWYRSPREYAVTQIVEQQNDASWDYAIVRLNGSPGREFGHANLGTVDPPANSTLTIIGHPFQLKEVHAGPMLAVWSQGPNWFSYLVDTEAGSSGAGILDPQGRLVGVHTDGGCFEGSPLRGNEGMRMSSLIAHSPTLTTLTQNKILWRYLNTSLVSIWNVDANGARTGGVDYNPGGSWAPLSYSNNRLTWRNSNGDVSVWTLNNAGSLLSAVASTAPYRWRPVSAANGRILWHHSFTNSIRLWTVDAAGSYQSHVEHAIGEGWTPVNYANNHILWRYTSGLVSLWRVDDAGNYISSAGFNLGPDWFPISYENGQLLWKKNDGSVAIWTLNRDNVVLNTRYVGPNPEWTPLAMSDRQLGWRHTSGLFSLWKVSDIGAFLGDFGHSVGLDWKPVSIAGARP
jgi:V8-like Glu-specific endopeptidase